MVTQIKICIETAKVAAESSAEHQRDDYKEFSELCLLYIDPDNGQFNFRRPGAVHKAWWMSQMLYSIKMVLLEEQIRSSPARTIATVAQQKKLRSFVTFVCLIYNVWWTTCRSAVDAPWNILCLYQNLLNYKQVSSEISDSALEALNRYLWYLSSEMVPVASFTDIVPKPELQYLLKKILTSKSIDGEALPNYHYATTFGKPKFPTAISATTRLGNLVCADSWYIVELLEMDMDFLNNLLFSI